MLDIKKVSESYEIPVYVQFCGENNTTSNGEFKATFRRLPQDKIDELFAAESTDSEVVDEVLVSVRGIGQDGQELPAEEQLAWVKRTPECVGACVAAFFKSKRPERYNEKTSRKRRGAG